MQAHENADLGMVPGQTALEIHGVGRTDGTVRGKLDGAALNKGTGGHDDLVVVAGHVGGVGGGEGIHGSRRLNALAESDHARFAAQFHRLNDVMAAFLRAGDAAEAQGFIQVGGENRALFRACHHRGGEEEALIQRRHQSQVRADLLTQTGSGKPVGAAVNALFRAADIAADGGKTAAGVLDQTAHGHVRAYVGGLDGLHGPWSAEW